jgi:hypothetical protein
MKTKPASKRGKGVAELRRQQRCLLTEVCPHKLKQTLVPIDFSDCSRKALRYAVPVAERFGAQLLLLYVIQTNVLPAELGYVPSEVKRAGIHSAQTALEEPSRPWARISSGRPRCETESPGRKSPQPRGRWTWT